VKICISKTTFGTPQHLLWDDGVYGWISRIPDDVWSFGVPGRARDLAELSHAMSLPLTVDIPEPQRRAVLELLGEDSDLSQIRWDQMLPPSTFKAALLELLQKTQELLKNSHEWKYLATFEKTQWALSGLAAAHISPTRLRHFRECAQAGRQDSLISFQRPGNVTYSRKTLTGRLTVASGPKFLTLDKKYRSILKSRHGKDGKIIQLDFVALEPRVLLGVTGVDSPDDPYTILSEKIPALERPALKRATMAILYGGKLPKLMQLLPDGVDAAKVMDVIRDTFRLRSLEDRLTAEFSTVELLMNYYGRVLNLNRSDASYLVAAYVQSTGVDVALQGFGQIREIASKIDGIDPFAIVHDALWLDVHRDAAGYTEQLKEAGSMIPGFDINFPLDEKEIK